MTTNDQYREQFTKCKELCFKKNKDYGTAWRIMRPSSLTDQIYIKAKRIRTLEINGTSKVDEGIESEYIGIVNYCILSMIQINAQIGWSMNLTTVNFIELYNLYQKKCRNLMEAKNHDYGEAWRDMRITSLTDLILMKIFRLKQIEDNSGKTLVSEGVEANYADILNYSIFALIKLSEIE